MKIMTRIWVDTRHSVKYHTSVNINTLKDNQVRHHCKTPKYGTMSIIHVYPGPSLSFYPMRVFELLEIA